VIRDRLGTSKGLNLRKRKEPATTAKEKTHLKEAEKNPHRSNPCGPEKVIGYEEKARHKKAANKSQRREIKKKKGKNPQSVNSVEKATNISQGGGGLRGSLKGGRSKNADKDERPQIRRRQKRDGLQPG